MKLYKTRRKRKIDDTKKSKERYKKLTPEQLAARQAEHDRIQASNRVYEARFAACLLKEMRQRTMESITIDDVRLIMPKSDFDDGWLFAGSDTASEMMEGLTQYHGWTVNADTFAPPVTISE